MINRVISLLFPHRCIVCDKPVKPYGSLVCRECLPKIRYIKEPTCFQCGKMLADDNRELCSDCQRIEHMYDRGLALYDYNSMRQSLYCFKYHNRKEYAIFYGQDIKRVLGWQIQSWQAEALIPIPLHKSKLRQRGYNQAGLLARSMGKELGIPVREDILVRQRSTLPQKGLNPKERQNNLKKAFKIVQNDVKLKTIIIVDDIYTTGSTIDAASKVLREIGVEKIYFVTLSIGKGI